MQTFNSLQLVLRFTAAVVVVAIVLQLPSSLANVHSRKRNHDVGVYGGGTRHALDREHAQVHFTKFSHKALKYKQTSSVTTEFTLDQQTLIVDRHNQLRRGEGSSNMEILKWNTRLARLAQRWADKCSNRRGAVPFDADLLGFNDVGQNNWIGSGLDDVTGIVTAWYDEKLHFNYDSLQCAEGRSCDRYKQVVWSWTTDIGCGAKFCNTVGGLSNQYFVVCYYGPRGNFSDEKPFLKGPACTQCKRGQFFCNNELCDGSCRAQGQSCECRASCKNCASTTTDCRCKCKAGSTGIDCSRDCIDLDERCNRSEGWPKVLCRPNFQFVIDACPKMCGICRTGSPCSGG